MLKGVGQQKQKQLTCSNDPSKTTPTLSMNLLLIVLNNDGVDENVLVILCPSNQFLFVLYTSWLDLCNSNTGSRMIQL